MDEHNVYDVQALEKGFSVTIRNKKISSYAWKFDGDKPADRDALIRELLGAPCPGLQHELVADIDRGKAGWANFTGYGKKQFREYVHKVTCEEAPS